MISILKELSSVGITRDTYKEEERREINPDRALGNVPREIPRSDGRATRLFPSLLFFSVCPI